MLHTGGVGVGYVGAKETKNDVHSEWAVVAVIRGGGGGCVGIGDGVKFWR